MAKPRDKNPTRTGILGITIVVCLVLVSFGYSKLPFFPQGKNYTAYFVDAAGIRAGNTVNVAGIKVGSVSSVALEGSSAKVNFTASRKIKIGNRSMAAIKTESILGQKSLLITPSGDGTSTVIPLARTTSPYTLNTALQDLGRDSAQLDKPKLEQALQTMTDSLHDATPQLRGALNGITALSRSLNSRDEALGQLLQRAASVSGIVAKRASQISQLFTDGDQLFAALEQRRQALTDLIAGISALSEQVSGFVADNRAEFGPALQKLNLVLDNLNSRREHLTEALKRLPPFATSLGEVVGSGPGFNVNVYGVPPPSISAVLLDTVFQPGKLPESLADFLRGFVSERMVIRPQSQ